MGFADLMLHDAVLGAINVDWSAARCEVCLDPVGSAPRVLTFEGFSLVELPRRQSWGRSSSINRLRQPEEGVFDIEIQSGDTIRIEASSWSVRSAHG